VRGEFAHNRLLIAPIVSELRKQGATVHCEHSIGPRGRGGFVDILAILNGWVCVFEGERCADRVPRDVKKAATLVATLGTVKLVIIVPNAGVAKAVRRKLARLLASDRPQGLLICCLTIGVALQRLRNRSLLMSPSNDSKTSRHLTNQATQDAPTPPRNWKE
jgi:hypothetical protein